MLEWLFWHLDSYLQILNFKKYGIYSCFVDPDCLFIISTEPNPDFFQMELQEHTAKLEIQNLEAKYREKLTHLEQENFKLKRLSKGVYFYDKFTE